MGAGLDMQPGDIAFKSNFATLDTSTGIVLHRRADRRFEVMGPILCEYLDGRWKYLGGRMVLWWCVCVRVFQAVYC